MSKVVAIAGASSGIGLATAERAASRGDTVVLLARGERQLQAALTRVRGLGAEASAITCDITKSAQVSDAVNTTLARHQRIDAWIQCAAVMTYGELVDTPPKAFRKVLETNVLGVVNAAHAVLPVMRRQNGGSFVVLGSLLGHIAAPDISPYVTSKWALRGLLNSLRLEQRSYPDVHVVEVAPRSVDTPIFDRAARFLDRSGKPPPPVDSAQRLAKELLNAVDHPPRWTRTRFVGATSRAVAASFSLIPPAFDAVMASVWRRIAMTEDAPALPKDRTEDGAVFSSLNLAARTTGGWEGHWRPRSLIREHGQNQ